MYIRIYIYIRLMHRVDRTCQQSRHELWTQDALLIHTLAMTQQQSGHDSSKEQTWLIDAIAMTHSITFVEPICMCTQRFCIVCRAVLHVCGALFACTKGSLAYMWSSFAYIWAFLRVCRAQILMKSFLFCIYVGLFDIATPVLRPNAPSRRRCHRTHS